MTFVWVCSYVRMYEQNKMQLHITWQSQRICSLVKIYHFIKYASRYPRLLCSTSTRECSAIHCVLLHIESCVPSVLEWNFSKNILIGMAQHLLCQTRSFTIQTFEYKSNTLWCYKDYGKGVEFILHCNLVT